MKSFMVRIFVTSAIALVAGLLFACGQEALGQTVANQAAAASQPAGSSPKADGYVLKAGPQLFVDDYLIARSEGIQRKVGTPKRTLQEPVLTGSLEHQNWQPFLTVQYDAAAAENKRFRMWYNVDVLDDPRDGEYAGKTGYRESADGIHWPGPYKRLDSLPVDGRPRFGACVLDDGPQCATPSERYKIMYFDAGQWAGPRVAFSGDGVKWTMVNEGKPILKVNNGDDTWTACYDPIRKRYFLIGKKYAPFTWTNAEGQKVKESIRLYFTSFSQDFKTWSEPKGMIFSPDEKDSGITQWYGAAGLQVRGGLIIGFLRVLRDDKTTEGAPEDAIKANSTGWAGLGGSELGKRGGAGMGYTVLCWTRDGVTWQRDRHTDPFLEPDPKVGTWDHAMSWIGSSTAVGDDLYLYYAGYRWGHKYHHSTERQIGLVTIKRDRYVARVADKSGGQITTAVVKLDAGEMTLNADASSGEIFVQVSDVDGKPLPGYSFADCQPIKADGLNLPVKWSGKSLADLHGKTVRLQFSIKNASLYAFDMADAKK